MSQKFQVSVKFLRIGVIFLGEVKKALMKLGINIFVVGANEEIVTEVKRFGLYHDLENFLHMRVGDKLTLYLTKGE